MEFEPSQGQLTRAAHRKMWANAPEAFLLPGVFGDEQPLVDLRHRLQGTLNLELVEIPSGRSQGCVLTDMVATGNVLADEIVKRRPYGYISLVGYSFGASVALEVAAQLIHRKRHIAFLGILDGPFGTDELPGRHAELQQAVTVKGMIRKVVVDIAGSVDETRRAVLTLSSPAVIGADRSNLVRRAVLTHLRNKALRGWTPPRCEAQGLHVFTGNYGSFNRARWVELCPNLTQVPVEVFHERLLEDALEAVATALTKAIGVSFK